MAVPVTPVAGCPRVGKGRAPPPEGRRRAAPPRHPSEREKEELATYLRQKFAQVVEDYSIQLGDSESTEEESTDRLLYYVTGRMVFTATCTLTSGMFEEHTHIWRTSRLDEDYPWRIRIKSDVVLEDAEWLPAKELAYRLEYVRKWPPEHWTLAFQGHVHQLPQKDFKLIEDELRRLESARSVAS